MNFCICVAADVTCAALGTARHLLLVNSLKTYFMFVFISPIFLRSSKMMHRYVAYSRLPPVSRPHDLPLNGSKHCRAR